MSAVIAIQIICDIAGCYEAFDPSFEVLNSIGDARREAHADGWVSAGPRGNDRKDYCPQHAHLGAGA